MIKTDVLQEMKIPAVFEPDQTLDCGQSFRWEKVGEVWQGVAFGKRLSLRKEGETLLLSCTKQEFEEIWRTYFDLDTDYPAIRQELSKLSPVLQEACAYAGGIRILRQDAWEALCSFIISQNNNIPRIKGIIRRLCETLGEQGSDGEFLFPGPERLAISSLEELAPLRAGFRAKYLLSAARLVTEGKVDLQEIPHMEIGKARETLMLIHGVGPKVAECALLYGFHRLEAFPIDVWMKRVMERWFPEKKPEDFGPYAGVAQQYLFHYIRTFEKENF